MEMEKENSPHGRVAAGDTTVREGRRGRGAPVLVDRGNTFVGQDRRDQCGKRKGELI
jgi:hypothetical protein